MSYLGNYKSGDSVDFTFSTKDTDGAPITLASGAVSVYKGNNTTQTTTGVTLTTDFDSVTGLHHVRIATTDSFYATGEDYSVVITTGTVDSISVVGTVLRTFSIEKRFAEANVSRVAGTNSTTQHRLVGTTVSHTIGDFDNQLVSGHGALVNVGDRMFIAGKWRRITQKAGDEVEFDDETGLGGASGGDAYILPWVPVLIDANTVEVLGTAVDASPTPLDVNLVSIAGATAAVSGSGNITFTRGSTVSTLTAAQVNTEADTALSDVGLTSTITGRIDAAITSRMATYTQPTGFLAATFPTGTIANTTNITGGTITTVTNLTNLPSIPANWLTAAGTAADFGTEVGTAVWATATRQLTGTQTFNVTGNITGNLSGSVGSVTGAVGSVTGAVGSVTGNVGGNVVGSVGSVTTVNDKTGYSLATAPLDAAGVRTAIGLASANLDTQLAALPTDTENADALLDRANGIETGWTFRQTARVMLAVLAGKSSNDGATYRDVGDTKARVTATVDADGNRTAVTTDAT
jgi:hypothetical protein